MGKVRQLSQEDAEKMALALPETRKDTHMGNPDVRVGKHIMLGLPRDKPTVANLKSTSANVDALTQVDPQAYRDAWAGRWLGVDLTRITRSDLNDLVVEAWRVTAPKRLVKRFDSGDITKSIVPS